MRLVEADNGDFAVTVVRLLVFSTYRLALAQRLAASRDQVLAAIAGKAVKELTYHRDHAGRWVLTLAQGTAESRRRRAGRARRGVALARRALPHPPVERTVAEQGVGVDPAALAQEVDVLLEQVLSVSARPRPYRTPPGPSRGAPARDGRHTEAMVALLAEMQVVARAHRRVGW